MQGGEPAGGPIGPGGRSVIRPYQSMGRLGREASSKRSRTTVYSRQRGGGPCEVAGLSGQRRRGSDTV